MGSDLVLGKLFYFDVRQIIKRKQIPINAVTTSAPSQFHRLTLSLKEM